MGFGGELKVLVGFDAEGKIIDYSLLSHVETPGLGSKAADWFKKGNKGDITGMNPGEAALTVSKDGGKVDAITASTITSRAFFECSECGLCCLCRSGNCRRHYRRYSKEC